MQMRTVNKGNANRWCAVGNGSDFLRSRDTPRRWYSFRFSGRAVQKRLEVARMEMRSLVNQGECLSNGNRHRRLIRQAIVINKRLDCKYQWYSTNCGMDACVT